MATNFAVLSATLLCLSTVTVILAQENVDTNVAKSLQECYNNTENMEANSKMPMTINILIDLIRKIENGPSVMDLKVLSTNILQRFRQDGIRKAMSVRSALVLPYSPQGHENYKFSILLKYLVPGTAMQFPNETLRPIERCTMHTMLSESVELRERGDEVSVCNRLEKYRRRIPRSASDTPPDVEVVPAIANLKSQKNGKLQLNPNSQVDYVPTNRNVGNGNNVPISTCPIENGVIYTKWGAISAGNLIAGIAAGSEPQSINVKQVFGTEGNHILDNVWGATLAGDLAEAAYYSMGNNMEIKIGSDGGWSNTQVPHNYYLSKNTDYYMTDAEIRGGLDGLILGTKMKEYRNSVRSMRLSQLLDMYYSERGVFGEDIKSCKRRELFKGYATTDDMKDQALAFGTILNKKVTVQLTMNEEAIQDAVNIAVNNLDAYVSTLRDASCINDKEYQSTGTDLVILLDFGWSHDVIYPALSYLLDNLHVNLYNSNYTIINAQNGQIVVNSTNSLLDYHLTMNRTYYDLQTKGFDINIVVRQLELLTKAKMNYERSSSEPAGRSMTSLFVAHITDIPEKNKDFIIDRINEVFKTELPDLKLLAVTSGAKEIFENIVTDSTNDVFQLGDSSDGNSIISSVTPVIDRINEIPRRIIYSKCGSDWSEDGNDKQIVQYVEPRGINFYRIHPNYFYGDGTRTVKIKGQGNGVLSICYSRDIILPRSNSVNNSSTAESSNVVCKQITNDEYAIELSDPCSGKSTISECSPLYISVSASQIKSGQYETCTEKACRYPDNLKFTVTLDNFGCFSTASLTFTTLSTIITMLCFIFVRNVFHN